MPGFKYRFLVAVKCGPGHISKYWNDIGAFNDDCPSFYGQVLSLLLDDKQSLHLNLKVRRRLLSVISGTILCVKSCPDVNQTGWDERTQADGQRTGTQKQGNDEKSKGNKYSIINNRKEWCFIIRSFRFVHIEIPFRSAHKHQSVAISLAYWHPSP